MTLTDAFTGEPIVAEDGKLTITMRRGDTRVWRRPSVDLAKERI